MTSSNGNIFRVTGHLYGEFIDPRWIPRTKASDAELWCFLWSAPNKHLSKHGEAGDLRHHRAHYDVLHWGTTIAAWIFNIVVIKILFKAQHSIQTRECKILVFLQPCEHSLLRRHLLCINLLQYLRFEWNWNLNRWKFTIDWNVCSPIDKSIYRFQNILILHNTIQCNM